MARPNLKVNCCIGRHGNRAPHPTPSQGEVLHKTFFALHRIRGKDPLEIDGVTSVLALLNGRLHMTLLIFFIIEEPGFAVEQIIPRGEK